MIVVDGNQTETCVARLVNATHRRITLEKDEGVGVYAAMNQGVRRASGRWTIFMNGGDRFAGSQWWDCLTNSKAEEIIVGKAVNEAGEPLHEYGPAFPIWKQIPANHQSCFYRTELLRREQFNERWLIAGDFDHFLRLAKQGLSFQYEDALVAIVEAGGLSAVQPKKRVMESYRIALRYHKGLRLHWYYWKKLVWASRKEIG